MTEDSQLNGCYASHIVIHCGTHVVKIPDHVQDKMAATANCALATMINAVSDVLEKRSPYDTVVVIQVCYPSKGLGTRKEARAEGGM